MNSFFTQYTWATYGRRESAQELWKKCLEQKSRVYLFKKDTQFAFVLYTEASTQQELITATLESLKEQSYPKWQLIVVSDTAKNISNDSRVKIVSLNRDAIKESIQADYTGTIEAGAILNPSALYHFALAIEKATPELLYCHEVQMENGTEKLFSKPEYSYLSLLNQNYIGKLWLAKTSLFLEWDGKNEHLFFLKNARLDSHWKLVPIFGVRRNVTPLPHVSDEQFQQVIELANKSGLTCHARRSEYGWNILPDSSVAVQSKVSVIVCFKDKADWTIQCLKNLVAFAGKVNVEVILVNNNSRSHQTDKLKSYLKEYPLSHILVDFPHAFNFGHMHNWAIENYATGEYLFLLNNDVFLNSENCLKDMLGWSALSYVGTVGCLLRYKDGRIQHAGLTAFVGDESRLVRVGNEQSEQRLWNTTREVFGNTFAACLMKKSVYTQMGGFRELDLANGFGDVAFNLECLKAGLKNVNLGYIEGLHLESASRGTSYEYWEECILEQEYPELLQRMVRYDFGYDRMPISSSSLRDLKNYTKAKLRQNFPWLKDVKSKLIEIKSGVKALQLTYKT